MNEVKLRIKSPSAAIGDIYVDAELTHTVLHVKELITAEYPTHPAAADQKLVYAGRLLQDTDLVKNVLRKDTQTICIIKNCIYKT